MLDTVEPQLDPEERTLLEALDAAMENGDLPSQEAMVALLTCPQTMGALHSVVHGLSRGQRVEIVVHDEDSDLSPLGASKVLGVSRKLVNKLLDDGTLPHHTLPGSTHKKIRLADVSDLKAEQERKRRGIDEIMDHLDDLGVEY